MNPRRSLSVPRLVAALGLGWWLVASSAAAENTAAARFDSANLLYEKGQYESAAQAYEALLGDGARSAPLLFNAGNAWFKSGKRGRAVARWLQAEVLEPRNDRIQVNLEFVRKEVNGGLLPTPRWPAQLRLLSLDEWTLILLGSGWLLFGTLTLMAWRPAWRGRLKLPAALGGLAFIAILGLLVLTLRERAGTVVAVVVTDEAVVRFGPLTASQSAFVARDGMEFRVVDRKDEWLRIADGRGRDGWLPQGQVIQLRGGEVLDGPGASAAVPLQARIGNVLELRP